jgi:hypothetical protein
MSKQRELLPRLVREIHAHVPAASVLLTGSVQRGEEQPASDIDLLIIVSDVYRVVPWCGTVAHETATAKVVEAEMEGIPVTFNFIGAGLFGEMTAKPWKYYPFAKAEGLHLADPVLAAVREKILEWFAQRPDIEARWQQQLELHRRAKRSGNTELLQFPFVTDFADYLDIVLAAESPSEVNG